MKGHFECHVPYGALITAVEANEENKKVRMFASSNLVLPVRKRTGVSFYERTDGVKQLVFTHEGVSLGILYRR